jgi:serine/threonine protein kinase
MEKCLDLILENDYAQDTRKAYKVILKKDIDVFKQSFILLQKLKIIHADIKCENIMYSLKKKKIVFIDFGTTTLVK